ncbi:hypothetical protein KIPB_011637, partial [Kipferlia bialata]
AERLEAERLEAERLEAESERAAADASEGDMDMGMGLGDEMETVDMGEGEAPEAEEYVEGEAAEDATDVHIGMSLEGDVEDVEDVDRMEVGDLDAESELPPQIPEESEVTHVEEEPVVEQDPEALLAAWTNLKYTQRLVYDASLSPPVPVRCLAKDREAYGVGHGQRSFVAGYLDGSIRRWDMTPLTPQQQEEAAAALANSSVDDPVGIDVVSPSMVVSAHQGAVLSLDQLGGLVASGGEDARVRLWDGSTGESILSAKLHASAVNAVKLLNLGGQGYGAQPDCVVSAGKDRSIQLFDIRQRELRTTFTGHMRNVYCLDARGKSLASGSGDHTARLWDLVSGREGAVLRGHTGRIRTCCFGLTDAVLATGSSDRTVRLWDTRSTKATHLLKGHTDHVTSLEMDELRLVSGSQDGCVRVWDRRQTLKCLHTLKMHEGYVTGSFFYPDLLVSSSTDGFVMALEFSG